MDSAAEAAFNEFVTARSARLARSAYLLTGDAHLAEDLVQAALLAIARNWHRLEGDPEAYARRVIVNQSVSWWRRRRWQESALTPTADRAQLSADPDAALSVARALALLTPKQRAVLVLRYFDDLTEVQTAATLGVSVGTVKSTTRQAFDRLRRLAPELGQLMEEAR